jgi:hypothetical protein
MRKGALDSLSAISHVLEDNYIVIKNIFIYIKKDFK